MKKLAYVAGILLFGGLSACSSTAKRSCDEALLYLNAVDGKRVEAPDGLSQLDPLKEIPLPEASPRPPRPADAPCLDLPPGTTIQKRSENSVDNQEAPKEEPE